MKKRWLLLLGIVTFLLVGAFCAARAWAAAQPPVRITEENALHSEALVWEDVRYSGDLYEMDIPANAEILGEISKVTQHPSAELECTFGEVGKTLYTFQFGEFRCFGFQRPWHVGQSLRALFWKRPGIVLMADNSDDGPIVPDQIFWQGELHCGMTYYMEIPLDAKSIGRITEVTAEPSIELACTFGDVGNEVFYFEYNGYECFGYQQEQAIDQANGYFYQNGGIVLVSGAEGLTPPAPW